MKFDAVTLSRPGDAGYQVTIWPDGVMRWDGTGGGRVGAWQSQLRSDEVAAWTEGVDELPPTKARRPGPLGAILIETPTTRHLHRLEMRPDPASVWRLAMLTDGLCLHSLWVPLDVTSEHDFSRFVGGTLLTMHDRGAHGMALAAGPENLLLLAGSTANAHSAHSLHDGHKRRRAEMLEDGTLLHRDDVFLLTRHLLFSTPSAPASILAGHNLNGRQAWRDHAGLSWSQIHIA